MIIEEKKLILKNGQACILRSSRLDDAEQLIEYLKVTVGETNFLLKYPEEVKITVEQEKDILQWFIDSERDLMIIAEVDGRIVGNCSFSPVGRKIRVRHRCSLGIALYEKIRFEKFGIRPKAMKHKDGTYDDEIMMVKYL